MGFFGLVLSSEKQQVDVPPGFSLQLLMACLELEGSKKDQYASIHVQPGTHETFILGHLNPSKDVNVAIQQEFGIEDSPITLWCSSGKVHVTGRWALSGDDEDADGGDEEEEGEEEENFCQVIEPVKAGGAQESSSKKRPRKEDNTATSSSGSSNSSSSSSSSNGDGSAKQSKSAKKKAKAAENEELLALAAMMAPQIVEAPTQAVTAHHRKKWKIKPENDEGVAVPEPKQRTMPCGVLYTDYIVGRGVEPKLGTKIKITYEGSFPDGTVFDSRVKRSKPFVFRKGAADVIRGLDLGVEGMRVGGSREIILPAALGYGKEGAGREIPPNQVLIFRITLVGKLDG